MLRSLKLDRFKSICRAEPIPLEAFSLLCGSNSSGKSSLIQSILFLCQTLSSRFDRTSFVLNGAIVKLGSFGDIRSYFSNEESFEISFSLDLSALDWMSDDLVAMDVRFLIGKRNGSDASLEDELHPVIMESEVRLVSVRDGEEVIEFLSVTDDMFLGPRRLDDETENYRIKLFSSPELDRIEASYPGLSIIGCKKNNIFPTTLVFDYDHTLAVSAQAVAAICGVNQKTTLLGASNKDLEKTLEVSSYFITKLKDKITGEIEKIINEYKIPDVLLKALKANSRLKQAVDLDEFKRESVKSKFPLDANLLNSKLLDGEQVPFARWQEFLASLDSAASTALLSLIAKHQIEFSQLWYEGAVKERRKSTVDIGSFYNAANYLKYYFSMSIKYLGPLRNEPKAIYPALSLADPYNVGFKGENSAAVLHVNQNKTVVYNLPIQKAGGELEFELKATTLIDACRAWLSYLGVLNDFKTTDTGKLGYELKVKTNASDTEWQDLTHVGVGVSQVLPIVLMALLSDKGDILIFEQPELHLHPKVQSRLCDFFISMALADRQCLVETHSEYMITRLRVRIAQSEDFKIQSNSSILFVDKVNGVSNFKKVDVSRFGAITDWPMDFFDDNNKEVEIIIREAARKKKKERAALLLRSNKEGLE